MRHLVLVEPGVSYPLDGPTYRFQGASGPVKWPRTLGTGLGPAGAWNTLWRLGVVPISVPSASCPPPAAGDVLYVCSGGRLHESALRTVEAWLARGGGVVGSGPGDTWGRFIGADSGVSFERPDHPYGGLAYVFPGRPPELIAPPGWCYLRVPRPAPGTETFGKVAVVHGERQTPERALIRPVEDAPAVVRHGRFLYLNGNPFAASQAWLQGQEDLGPWLQWRHRLFWLDEMAACLGRLLEAWGALAPLDARPGVAGLGSTTVVLRHDLDSSRDTTYVDEEQVCGLPGVHGILKDRNTGFWVKRLREHPGQETALHYNTMRPTGVRGRLRLLSAHEPPAARPATREIAGRGLLRQVRSARARGIGVSTLHRHGSFLLYPEWIDALHHVFEKEPDVLAGSSLFRAHVLRWGVDRVDGIRGSLADFPDAQFPFWLPFRAAHAGLQGLLLRGWETTSVMEIEPELFEQMLDHRVAGTPQRVLVLNFHPAHARRPTFSGAGSWPAFRRVLDTIVERGLEVRTLRDVVRACDRALAAQGA